MPTSIRYTITDPKVLSTKNAKRRKNVKDDAPKPPCGRFGVTWSIETDTELHGEGRDGYIMNYMPKLDTCDWQPSKTFYGGFYHNLTHTFETTKSYIYKALGFPEYNPGWEVTGSEAQANVLGGLYLKVLTEGRIWRDTYMTSSLIEKTAKASDVKLADEIGEFVDGTD